MAATITFLQLAKSSTDLTTYTFSAQSVGTAAADRYIICGVSGRSSDGGARTISSVTIGGVTATLNVQMVNSGNVQGIACALVPTGTTADVVVVFSSTMTNADIALYSTSGLTSTSANDTGTSTANVGTYALNVAAGGVAVALMKSDDETSVATWAGLTETYDEADANSNDISGAAAAFATTQTNLTVSCTWDKTPVRPAFAVASFAPNTMIFTTGAGDGSVNKSATTYAGAHDATSGTADYTGTSGVVCQNDKVNASQYDVTRYFFPIDTSALPDGATVTAATFQWWFTADSAPTAFNPDSDAVSLIQTSQASTSSLTANDFDNVGTTKGATDLNFASVSTTAGYQKMELNATGLGWISKTGYTLLGLRSKNDIANSAPTGRSFLDSVAYYENTINKPARLTVTYTTTNIKSINGLAVGSVKSFDGLAIGSVKSINGLA